MRGRAKTECRRWVWDADCCVLLPPSHSACLPAGWSHTQLGPELPIRPWAFDNRQPESPHCVAAEKSGLLPGAGALSSLRRWPGSRARSRGKVDERCSAPRLGLYPPQGSLPPGQLSRHQCVCDSPQLPTQGDCPQGSRTGRRRAFRFLSRRGPQGGWKDGR